MDALPAEDINGPGKRRGYRRNKDCEAPVLELFNNERRDKRVFDLDQRWLPRGFAIFPSHLLG